MMQRLTARDGHALDCWIVPATEPRKGGIVIVQEIFGLTDQLKDVAALYAGLGYEVAVPALFDRQERRAVIPFDEAPRGRDLMLSIAPDDAMADIAAAVEALAPRGKVAVIGYCWGGGLAIRAAQTLPIAGAVAYYGTRLPQYLDRPLQHPLLAHFGRHDDHAPPALVKEAMAALPDMEVHLYDAGHAFANSARTSFAPEEAALAQDRTVDFLERVMA
jgi:carboxymethylenebutenolidase